LVTCFLEIAMKTHILQLEQHDDVVSTRDKMGWAKTGRILLVWPERGRGLYRRLDLALLQRHSASLGAQLAFVTRDPDVLYYAPRLGIPVFKSLRRAQRAPWRVPRRFRKGDDGTQQADEKEGEPATAPQPIQRMEHLPPRPEVGQRDLNPAARLAFFALGVLALLSIAAILAPSAQVILTPIRQEQLITIEVSTAQDAKEISLAGVIPAHWSDVTVEGRENLPVSGSIRLPDREAIGHVVFTNLTDQPVEIPEGTVARGLEQGSLRFEVTQAGTVPGGAGESVTLPVRCQTPGSLGNLPAGSLVAIEGLLGTRVSVTNPQPTGHGSDREEPAPTRADRQRLSVQLRQALETTALEELKNNLGEGDLLLPASLMMVEVVEEAYQPADIAPADLLELSLRLKYRAMFVSGDDIHELARAVLDANLPAGFSPIAGTLEIENLSEPVFQADSSAHWKLQTSRQIQAQLPEAQAIQLSMGLEPLQAAERLENAMPLASSPEILLFPTWWPRMPILPFRIRIDISG
jgi:hypothetical protein